MCKRVAIKYTLYLLYHKLCPSAYMLKSYMDVFTLPNRTFTNPSQFIQTNSTDQRAQNRFLIF